MAQTTMKSNVYEYNYWMYAIARYEESKGAYKQAQENFHPYTSPELQSGESIFYTHVDTHVTSMVDAVQRLAAAEYALSNAYLTQSSFIKEPFLLGNTGRYEETVMLNRNVEEGWVLLFESNDEFMNEEKVIYSSYQEAQKAFYCHVSEQNNPLPSFMVEEIQTWHTYASSPSDDGEGQTRGYKKYGLHASIRFDADGMPMAWSLV